METGLGLRFILWTICGVLWENQKHTCILQDPSAHDVLEGAFRKFPNASLYTKIVHEIPYNPKLLH